MTNDTTTHVYICRVECSQDWTRIVKKALKMQTPLTKKDSQDNDEYDDVRFSTTLTLDEVRALMRSVPDAHVARQTVQKPSDYTGIRNYTL